jgi:hypothetical protein
MRLADLQRALAASLTGGGPPPAGLGAAALDRARRALAAKRCRALRHLLPRSAAALGESLAACVGEHCSRYTPGAMLYHVDDAWELAAHLAAHGGPPAVRRAARDDLAMLRLRYARRRRPGSRRIRERRGLVVAWIATPRRALLVRLPGRRGLLWRFPAW